MFEIPAEQVELVARAMCRARGIDPESEVTRFAPSAYVRPKFRGPGGYGEVYGLAWEIFAPDARAHIVATFAMGAPRPAPAPADQRPESPAQAPSGPLDSRP